MRTRLGLAAAALVAALVIGYATCATSQNSGPAPRPTAGAESAAGASGSRHARAAPTAEPAWFGIRAAGGRRIHGHVYLAGAPVAARLALASAASDAGATAVAGGTAAADGAFDLGTHRAGLYRLLATAPGAEPRVVSVDCELGDADVDVFLTPCRLTVTGEVRDASGGSIAGATISTAGFTLATTDDAGRYELCIGDDNAMLVARADGYAAAGRVVNVLGAVALDFDLVPEATVVVHVTDADGVPTAGALVRATPSIDAGEDGPQPASGVTDAGGSVELRALAPSPYDLVATADAMISPVVAYDPAPGQAGDVELTLAGAASVRGRVSETGTPVPALRVLWIVDEHERGRAVTGDDGTFVITGVAPGAGDLTVESPVALLGRESAEATIAPGAPVELEVRRPHHVRGTVTRAGTPVGGATVQFLGRIRSTTTRADGGFELAFTPLEAQVDARIQADSRGLGAFGITTVALGTADVSGVAIELTWAGAIAGIVVDERGAPIPGVAVEERCTDNNDSGNDVTARDGTFTTRSLRGGCRYVPRLRLDGAALAPASGTWPEVDLPEGGSRDGVRLIARIVRSEVAGIVVDAVAAPVADALVLIVPGVREARSGVDGRFAISSTHDGPFRIEARASGMRTAVVPKVPAGTTDLRVVVAAPGAAHLTCADGFDGRLMLASMLHGRRRTVTCGQTVASLPVGPYVIRGDDVATRFEVEAGATAEVEVAPVGRTEIDVVLTIPPGVQATAPLTCQIGWMYVPGELQMEPVVAVVDNKAHLVARRGSNRIVCRGGPGLRGELRTQVGAEPATFTVKMVERSRP